MGEPADKAEQDLPPERYTFIGRISPEHVGMYTSKPFPLLMLPEKKASFPLTISIKHSQVIAVAEVPPGQLSKSDVRSLVEGAVRAEVDTLGFMRVGGYDVEIVSCLLPNGKHDFFDVDEPTVRKTLGKRDSELLNNLTEFQKVSRVTLAHPQFRHALRNLREAIRVREDTALFCYRAVESLRQYFVEEKDTKPKYSWKRLRTNLNIQKQYIMYLAELSEPQRHGEPRHLSSKERKEVLLRTLRILDRFFVFALRNKGPLPDDEFPMVEES